MNDALMTTTLVQQYNDLSSLQLRTLFDAQRKAFDSNPYPPIDERISDLKQLKSVIMAHQEQIIAAISRDFSHRSADDTRLAELLTFVESIDTALGHIRKWTKASKRKTPLVFMPASNKVVYQPLGVVGIMVPWNYPLFLSLSPLITAITAGNSVMLKLSEHTPEFNRCLHELLAKVFTASKVVVITGELEVSSAFTKLPFDHLFFTGSTNVGRVVMKAAAENLTPVTLELGGKSPVLISDNADIDTAAERICFGKSLNAGQTCVAPDYVLCPEHKVHDFVEAYKNAFARMYPSIKDNPDYGAIINTAQLQRLQGLLNQAKHSGAKCTAINPSNESFDDGRKMPPVLIENAPLDLDVMQQEIFGPLLPIVAYSTLEQAMTFINERPRPLALYLFSNSSKEHDTVTLGTHSGGVCINNTMTHLAQSDLPFGGIGDSGMGQYHGFEGFQTLSKAKSVHKAGFVNVGKLLYPPYGTRLHQLFYKFFVR